MGSLESTTGHAAGVCGAAKSREGWVAWGLQISIEGCGGATMSGVGCGVGGYAVCGGVGGVSEV